MNKYNIRVLELTELAKRKSQDLKIEFDDFHELKSKSIAEEVFFLGVYYLFNLGAQNKISREKGNELYCRLREESDKIALKTSKFDEQETKHFCLLHSQLASQMRKKKYREALLIAMQMLNQSNTPQNSIDYVELFNYETNSEYEDLD